MKYIYVEMPRIIILIIVLITILIRYISRINYNIEVNPYLINLYNNTVLRHRSNPP